MAFNVEIQTSQSRPQTNNNNNSQTNRNYSDTNTRGTEQISFQTGAAYDYNNNEHRKFGKYNINDPGATKPPTTTRHDSIQQNVTASNEWNHCFEQQQQQNEQHNFKQESNNGSPNTETEFETKNIFAYQAFAKFTGSVSQAICATPPPERIEYINTPPPSTIKELGCNQSTDQKKNHKNTLFSRAASSKSRSEKYTNKESNERGHSIPPKAFRVAKTAAANNNKLYSNTKRQFEEEYTTNNRFELFRAEFEQNRNEIQKPIDPGNNGRYRVDRCRYIPLSSGYEWSNAAYCYS